MEELEEHKGVLFCHLLRIAIILFLIALAVGQLCPLGHLLYALDLFLFIFDFALEGEDIARFIAPLDLRVVLGVIVEAAMALGVAGPRRLALRVEKSIRVTLRVVGNLDSWHVGQVGDHGALHSHQVLILVALARHEIRRRAEAAANPHTLAKLGAD